MMSQTRRLAVADTSALLACANNLLALFGGLLTLIAVPALPCYAMGLSGSWTYTFTLLFVSVVVRYLTHGRDATAREEDLPTRFSREFLLVPEALARWFLYGSSGVEVFEAAGGGNKMVISSLPSPALLRSLSRVNRRSRRVVVLNVSRSWAGWDELCRELGLDVVTLHT